MMSEEQQAEHQESVARLLAAPDPQSRARLLDIDFDRLVAARRRLLIGSWAIGAAIAVLVLLPMVVSMLAAAEFFVSWDPRPFIVSLLIGGVMVYTVNWAATLIVRAVLPRVLPGLTFSRHVYAAALLRVVVLCALLYLMGWLPQVSAIGMIAGAGFAVFTDTAEERNLPHVIATNPHAGLHSLAAVLSTALSLRGKWWQAQLVRAAISVGFVLWVSLAPAITFFPGGSVPIPA